MFFPNAVPSSQHPRCSAFQEEYGRNVFDATHGGLITSLMEGFGLDEIIAMKDEPGLWILFGKFGINLQDVWKVLMSDWTCMYDIMLKGFLCCIEAAEDFSYIEKYRCGDIVMKFPHIVPDVLEVYTSNQRIYYYRFGVGIFGILSSLRWECVPWKDTYSELLPVWEIANACLYERWDIAKKAVLARGEVRINEEWAPVWNAAVREEEFFLWFVPFCKDPISKMLLVPTLDVKGMRWHAILHNKIETYKLLPHDFPDFHNDAKVAAMNSVCILRYIIEGLGCSGTADMLYGSILNFDCFSYLHERGCPGYDTSIILRLVDTNLLRLSKAILATNTHEVLCKEYCKQYRSVERVKDYVQDHVAEVEDVCMTCAYHRGDLCKVNFRNKKLVMAVRPTREIGAALKIRKAMENAYLNPKMKMCKKRLLRDWEIMTSN